MDAEQLEGILREQRALLESLRLQDPDGALASLQADIRVRLPELERGLEQVRALYAELREVVAESERLRGVQGEYAEAVASPAYAHFEVILDAVRTLKDQVIEFLRSKKLWPPHDAARAAD